MHIIHVQHVYHLLWCAYRTALVRISDTDNMHTRAGGTHIIRVRYAYYLLWCAYQTQTICIQISCVCILSMSDMCTINVYAYCPCLICVPPAKVHISDTDDMHTNKMCMHIVHVQYAYQSRWYAYRLCPICILPALVRISSVSDMHIVCVQYAYHPCLICVPPALV